MFTIIHNKTFNIWICYCHKRKEDFFFNSESKAVNFARTLIDGGIK